ncbi:hypothetical protein FOL47_002974 [Perkinsus chesapeaki]|uniref:Uncharacterized protein n=1 Tax=Perkinsus chesapeaki TaxID=330153 RepID=A0A7J6MA86_PERCH|nr:hypothetical protein FOL47_002974 [Perkinsus chesapeaki]
MDYPEPAKGSSPSAVTTRTLSELIDARKRFEQDAELLANRIALLRNEGIRTEKRISEAKRRADELIRSKRENAEARLKRANKDDSEYKRLELIRMKACEQRESNRYRIREKLERVQDNKTDIYRQARDEKRAMTEIIEKKHEDDMKLARKRREYVRRSHYKANEARIKLIEERQAQRQSEMEKRYEKEEDLMKKTEAEIRAMEREEMELIRNLQNSQEKQREVYEYLEDILQAEPSTFLCDIRPLSSRSHYEKRKARHEAPSATRNGDALKANERADKEEVKRSHEKATNDNDDDDKMKVDAARSVSYITTDGVVVSLSDLLSDEI